MKKRISRLLALIMILTTLQSIQVSAADPNPLQFGMTTRMLSEGTQGLTEEAQIDESALAKWDISTLGKYELVYYIEAKGKLDPTEVTKKVNLVFDNIDGTNINVDVSTYTQNNMVADHNTYQRAVLQNSSGQWINEASTTTGPSYQVTLQKGNMTDRKDRELSLIVSDISFDGNNASENLKIRVKIEGNTISVWTNAIKKGNVTDFGLSLDAVSKGSAQVFNGPKNYEVTPTHFYKDGTNLASREVIEDYPNSDKTEDPGRRPGVKISFAKIKRFSSITGQFEYIQNPANAIVILRTDDNRETQLTFKPENQADILIDSATTITQAVQEVNNNIVIYMATSEVKSQLDGVTLQDKIITWDRLASTKRISSEFEFIGNNSKYQNDGYTYLQYDLSKTPSDLVKMNIQPYSSDVESTYYIYTANTKASLENKNNLVWDGLTQEQKERLGMIWPTQTKKNDANVTDLITANLAIDTQRYIRVGVEINGKFYCSQIVKCLPSQLLDIPEVTYIKNISNVYVVPDKDSGEETQPKAIGFDIEWNAPKKVGDYLGKGDLYYELILRTDKDDKSAPGYSEEATYSKIFKVSNKQVIKSGTTVDVPAVTSEKGTAGKEGIEDTSRYSEANNTFKMENVVLKNLGDLYWEQIKLDDNHWEQPSLSSLQNATLEKDLRGRIVPGVYYLSFRTIFVSSNGSVGVGGESNAISISLDNTVEIIPVPTNITSTGRINDKDGKETNQYNELSNLIISQDISFRDVNIKNYVDKMLEPAKNYLYSTESTKNTTKYKGEYEIYLYQKKDKLNETIAQVEAGTRTAYEISTTTGSALQVISLSLADIKHLRDGGAIPYKMTYDQLLGQNQPQFRVQGLDSNQVYYVTIRVKLSPWEMIGGIKQNLKALYSLFSAEHTFTSKTIPTPPAPTDKIPPAPGDIWIIEPIEKNTVTLGWSAADFEADADITKTYYEFIRSNKQLSKTEMSQSVEALVNADSNRIGFSSNLVNQDQPYIHTYLNSTAGWTKLTPEQLSNQFKITDNTLQPNNIYYYYVRTVCIVDNQTIKSSWIMVPVTTSPINPPIQLKVELAKDYSHDPKTEAVISFYAPIPEGASIPTDYDFDIAIQGELDNAYSHTKYTTRRLDSKQDKSLAPEGYTHFVYKITDLTPNKRYDIKVRVKDKTKALAQGETEYPTSLYSDKVTTRTEYDEQTQQEEDAYVEYLKKFDDAVEKLRRKPYWVVEEGTHYKYRESYINTEVAIKKEYELITDSNESEAYYYMPATAFMKINQANTILKINLADQTINIRPYTLTEENEQLKKAIELKKENELKDYYVALRVLLNKRTATINAETPISPEITIDMELVYMDQEDLLTEDEIMIELNTLITKERIDFISALEKKISKGTIADDVLQDLIDRAVKDIQADHVVKVRRIMRTERKRAVAIDAIEKAILIVTQTESMSVNAYYLETNRWSDIPTYMVGKGFGMEATRLGTYVFTGQKALFETVPEIAPYQTLISKYNLSDFFKLDSYHINTAATKQQIYGAVARMIGAQRGTDYTLYLKNNGIKGVTSIGLDKAIRQDEAIYVIMQGYEKIYKRPIDAIVIKNRQSVQNIGAFQAAYRSYVYAAVELKVVNNPNARVLPSQQLSVKEVLKMLNTIQAK